MILIFEFQIIHNTMETNRFLVSHNKEQEDMCINGERYGYRIYRSGKMTSESWLKECDFYACDKNPASVCFYGNGATSAEFWKNKNGLFHSYSGKPSAVYYDNDGKINYMSWYIDGIIQDRGELYNSMSSNKDKTEWEYTWYDEYSRLKKKETGPYFDIYNAYDTGEEDAGQMVKPATYD